MGYRSLLVLFVLLLAGCRILKGPTPEQFYLETLHLDHIPSSVTDLSGEGTDMFPVFASSGYLRYKATPSYWETLAQDANFYEKSEFNQKIHKVKCVSDEMPHDFSYWTKETIVLTNKTCFSGVYFPYVHYFVYEPATSRVNHFITGMRD